MGVHIRNRSLLFFGLDPKVHFLTSYFKRDLHFLIVLDRFVRLIVGTRLVGLVDGKRCKTVGTDNSSLHR